MGGVLGFLFGLLYSVLGDLNRFSSAPFLCVTLIFVFPRLGAPLPAYTPIFVTLLTQALAYSFLFAFMDRGRGAADAGLARRLAAAGAPPAIAGAVLTHRLAVDQVLAVWGLYMIIIAIVWWWRADYEPQPQEDGARVPTRPGLPATMVGAFMSGLTSTGFSELEVLDLVLRCRWHTRRAASTCAWAAALLAWLAALVHLIMLGGSVLTLDPWIPVGTSVGTIAGGMLGRRPLPAGPRRIATRTVALLLAGVGLALVVRLKPSPSPAP